MTTIQTRQLQQYTRPTNNNYTQDNLKLAKIHTRQIRILRRHHIKKKVTEHTTCVSISSTTFIWNISHFKENWVKYDQKYLVDFM
jgi:hypothetical protein